MGKKKPTKKKTPESKGSTPTRVIGRKKTDRRTDIEVFKRRESIEEELIQVAAVAIQWLQADAGEPERRN